MKPLRLAFRHPLLRFPARQSLSALAGEGGGPLDYLEGELAVLGADDKPVARVELTAQEHTGEPVVHPALNGAAQRACPELRVEAHLGDELDRSLGELHLDVLGAQAALSAVQQQPRYLDYLVLGERLEDDDLVYAVHELGSQMVPHDLHHVFLELLERLALLARVLLDPLS